MFRNTKRGRRLSERIGQLLGAGPLMAAAALMALSGPLLAESTVPAMPAAVPAEAKPWAFNLQLYTWLPGVNGKFSAGPLNKSAEKTFIDIVDASHRFPLGFMGRFEARYERFGVYLDGNWFDLDFKRKTGPLGYASATLKTEMGILDYGLLYRVSGPPDLANWNDTSGPNRLDVYVGARTLWLDNTIKPQRFQSVSASKTLTVPVVGGRIFVDFGRDWFVKIDGNIGGFGADRVDFTGGLLGSLGYRTALFDLPTAFELGYKALRVDVAEPAIRTRATLSGPFLGATAFW